MNALEKPSNKTGKHVSITDNNCWIVFASAAVLTYIPLVMSFGFFWDDWAMVFFNVTQGNSGFLEMFQSDRPFLSYLYQITSYLGNKPLAWQLFCVSGRLILSILFWWLLRLVMPDHQQTAFQIALLCTVYSGFTQMPIAYVWGNAFVLLNALVFSFCCTMKSLKASRRKNRITWNICSFAAFTFCVISTEYYIGLEMMRGLLLLRAISKADNKLSIFALLKRMLRFWHPQLLVLTFFLYWRIFIFGFPSYQPSLLDSFSSQPFHTLSSLIGRIIRDGYTASWKAWTGNFCFPEGIDTMTKSDFLFWIIVLISFFAFFHLLKNSHLEETQDDLRWLIAVCFFGAVALIIPGVPFWVTSLDITLQFPKDRFLVAYIFGSCALITGIILIFIHGHVRRSIVFSLFIAFAIGGNYLNANSYRKDWLSQKAFSDQLQTRIPALDGKTMLLSADNSFTYETDNSLTGMVNLLFYPENTSLDLPVIVSSYDVRFQNDKERISSTEVLNQSFRNATYSGSKDDILVYSYAPPACLKILDPVRDADLPVWSAFTYDIIQFSNPDNILSTQLHDSRYSEQVFGAVNKQSWCYAYETAELWRQEEKWAEIAALGDATIDQHTVYDESEYLPFIEAYICTMQWDKAIELLERINSRSKTLAMAVCPMIENLFAVYSPDDETERKNLLTRIRDTECLNVGFP